MQSAPASMSRTAAHVSLQVIVLLWGCTALLGRQISIAAVPLVWYRLALVVIALAAVLVVRRIPFGVPPARAWRYAGVGALIGIHWMCFYASVKIGGIATAVVTLSTVSFFTALVEPLVFRRRLDPGELVIGGLVVIGATLLIQVGLAPDPVGLVLGLASAIFAAVFGVLNGKLAPQERPDRLMFYEMSAALVVVSLGVVLLSSAQMVAPWNLSAADAGWLVVLSLVCTVIPQVWIIHVLRALSPFTVAITVNLEPVYSLLLAAFLFPQDRPPSPSFYAGAALVFGLVIVDGIRKSRSRGAR